MRSFRTVMGGVVAAFVYVLSGIALDHLGEGLYEDVAVYLYHVVLLPAVPAFLAFLLAGLLAAREYRHILVGTLLYVLYALQLWMVFPIGAFWHFVASLISLSFAAVGAYLAIAAVSEVGRARYRRKSGATRYGIPTFLTGMAFVSIPITYAVVFLSFFILLGVSALLLLLVLEVGHIPIILVVAIAAAPLFAALAAARGLGAVFNLRPGGIAGLGVETGQSPTLDALVSEVCSRLGTQRPDAIVLYAEPGAFVTQSSLRTMDETVLSGRILGLGAPLLYELDSRELKSILAHEFAHFTGKDTLYSRRVLPVFRTITSVLQGLAVRGSGTFGVAISVLMMVPRFCVLTFVRYFASIDSLLSRGRELRADLLAAESYGNQPFASALLKVTRSSLFFDRKLAELRPQGDFFACLHETQHSNVPEVDAMVAQLENRPESEFDSHPSLATRLASVPCVQAADGEDVPMERLRRELSPVLDGLSARLTKALSRDEDEQENEDQGEGEEEDGAGEGD